MSDFLDRLKARWRGLAGGASTRAEELQVGALSVQVTRKRVRNLTLRISPPHGELRVSAPMRASDAFIRRFVLDKLPWIERHRARFAALPPPAPLEPLTKAHRDQLKRAIPPLLEKWQRALGVQVAFWGVKQMKTRWGSCNTATRRIWLNLELARHPPEYLDYVVLHEVAHLLERGHGERFKAILSQHMPDWKARRAALRAHRPPSTTPPASP